MRKSALYLLGLVVAVLVALGLVILFSASEVKSARICGKPWFFVSRQLIYMAVGMVFAVIVAFVDYHRWRDNWLMTAFASVVIVVALWAVFLFPEVKGSHRWIPLPGGVKFQPGEVAKLLTVLVVSVWLDKVSWRIDRWWRGAFGPAALIGVFALPVMLEPDFGSVMVIGSVGFMLMFMAGTRFRHIVAIAVPALGLVCYKIFHNANRMARIAAFVGGAAAEGGAPDPSAYQGDMSIVAISRGSLWGVGLGRSMQKQNYLPEAWTDFIFAVGAEELGLVFSVFVLLLFLGFFGLCVYIARKAPDRFGRLLVMGMAFIIFFQAMFNLGVVCEAFPTKGMALPFFSYGGTNMVSAFIAVGMIFSVGRRMTDDPKEARPFSRKAQSR